MTSWHVVKIFRILKNWLHFWIYHPEISLTQIYNSITSLDIEFQPLFPRIWPNWECGVIFGGQNLKNIKKLASLLYFPSRNWSTYKFLTWELKYKTGNYNSFYIFFGKVGGGYEGRGIPCREITNQFQNFYHQFLISPGYNLFKRQNFWPS